MSLKLDEQTLRAAARSTSPGALEQLAALVDENPQAFLAWKFYGLSKYRRGEYHDASEYLSRATAISASDRETNLYLMRAHWTLGQKIEAARVATRIVELEPGNVEALQLIARVHHHREDYATALQWWRRAAEHSPEDDEVALRVARLASREGDHQLAAEVALGVRGEQHAAEAVQIAANALYQSRRFDDLLGIVPDQFALSPEHALRTLDKVDPMAYAEPVAKALADIRTAAVQKHDRHAEKADSQKMSPALVELRNTRAVLEAVDVLIRSFVARWHTEAVDCELTGNDLAAARLFRAIRIVDPTTARSGITRLKATSLELMRDGIASSDADAVIRHARQVLGVDPEDVEAHFAVGRTLLLTGRHEEARASFAACVRQEPDNDWFWVNHARASARSDDTTAAVAAFSRVLELVPDECHPYRQEASKSLWNLYGPCIKRGRAALDDGNLGEAWIQCATASTLRPEHEAHATLRARVLRALFLDLKKAYKNDDRHQIVRLGRQYCDWDPDNVDALVMLGRGLMKQRDYPAAMTVWEKVAELAPDDAMAQLQVARCGTWVKDASRASSAARRALALDSSLTEAADILNQLDAETV